LDRQIVYVGQIPQDTDLLLTNKNTMVAFGYVMQALLGTGTVVDGLACTPTSPAGMTVNVAGGSIYSLDQIDATAYGSVSPDTTDQIVKQGIIIGTENFSCPPPVTSGQSVVYLIEAAYEDVDTGSTVLPYYNASNPAVAYSGPSNSGMSQNTIRQGLCKVQVKTGVAATTGTQVTPSPDAGFTGLYAVTVANGQTTITSGNIAQLMTAPFIGTKLPGVLAAIQSGASTYTADTSSSANTITVAFTPAITSLTDGLKVRVKVANTNTGSMVMNTNGLGNVAVVNPDGSTPGAGAFAANGIYDLIYDANGTRWQSLSISASTASPIPTGSVMDYAGASAPTGWLLCFGQAISRTTYSALFALLSTTYGVGDGSTTFNLPDYRGRVGAGVDNMGGSAAGNITTTSGITGTTLGSAGGEQTHALVTGELASHTHTATVTDSGHTHIVSNYKEIAGSSGGTSDKYNSDGNAEGGAVADPTTQSATTGITVANSNTGSGTAHNNLQPTIMINKIIKT
jgi:microcystin-dependent protein